MVTTVTSLRCAKGALARAMLLLLTVVNIRKYEFMVVSSTVHIKFRQNLSDGSRNENAEV
jgi:hypothetical protein